jgi:hypothetical protein
MHLAVRQGMGCGVCDMFLTTCDLVEDRAVSSNLSVPKVPEPDVAATSACAKSRGSMFIFSG